MTKSIINNVLGSIILLIIALTLIGFGDMIINNNLLLKKSMIDNKLSIINDENNLQTFLSIYNPYTKTSNFKTIISSIKTNYKVKTSFGYLNLSDILKSELNFFYGKNNYQLDIVPHFNLKFFILYDDGKFLSSVNEKYNFSKIILNLVNDLKKKNIKLITDVYILSNVSNSPECSKYKGSVIKCHTINYNSLYSNDILKDYDNIKLNDIIKGTQNQVYSMNDWATFLARVSLKNKASKDDLVNQYVFIVFSDAVDLGGASNSFFNFKFQTKFPKCVNLYKKCLANYKLTFDNCLNYCKNIANGNQDTFNNCYGYLSKYITFKYTDLLYGFDNGITGGKTCYYYYYTKEKSVCVPKYLDCAKSESKVDFGKYFYDYYCVKNTNLSKSFELVNRIIPILTINKDKVFFINVEDTNITETPKEREDMKLFDRENNSVSFTTTPERNHGNPITIFGKVGCDGTFENQTVSLFHPETEKAHYEELENVAKNTNGLVINYSIKKDIKDSFVNIVNNLLDKFKIKIGVNETNKKPFTVIKKKYYLKINDTALELDINLKVFRNNYNSFENEIKFLPVLINYSKTYNKNYTLVVYNNKDLKGIKIDDNFKSEDFKIIKNLYNSFYIYNFSFDKNLPNNIKNLSIKLQNWENTDYLKNVN